MESIAEKQQEVIEEFSLFEDWMQRYEHMIDLGKSLPLTSDPPRPETYRFPIGIPDSQT